MAPVTTNNFDLLLRVKREDIWDCYDPYIYEGMDVELYNMSHDQNKDLELNIIWTENYQEDDDRAFQTKG